MTIQHNFETPMLDPCPFCEMIAGRKEWVVVEDCEETIAFINRAPPALGHLLVITRRHVPTVLDLTAAEAAAIMQAVVRLTRAVSAAFAPHGMNVFQNNGVLGSQSVPHFHFHVLPRYQGDGWRPGIDRDVPIRPLEERLEIAERIKRYLAPS